MSASKRWEAAQRAMDKGAAAHAAGTLRDDCPYKVSDFGMGGWWQEGWDRARDAAESAERAAQYAQEKAAAEAQFWQAMRVTNAWLATLRCSSCHTAGEGTEVDGSWRWTGSTWEHKCLGSGQAGHFSEEPNPAIDPAQRAAAWAAVHLLLHGTPPPQATDGAATRVALAGQAKHDGLGYDGDGRLVPCVDYAPPSWDWASLVAEMDAEEQASGVPMPAPDYLGWPAVGGELDAELRHAVDTTLNHAPQIVMYDEATTYTEAQVQAVDVLLDEATGRPTRITGGQDGAVLELGQPSRIPTDGGRPTTVAGSAGIWTPEGERKQRLTLIRSNGAPAAPQAPTPTI